MALTRISTDQIEPGSITAELLAPGAGAGPVIANVQIANSSYSALDDTAVALAGGYIILNGSNFGSNTQVIVGNTLASSVTYVSATEIRAEVPAKSAGSYIVYLVNQDTGATAIRVNGLTYSGVPSWSTGSTLTEGAVDEAISIQLSATSDTSVTYQLQAGSTLPTGLTLAANGLLSGTVTGLNEDTLYNFTVEAIDAENQESPRAFSITITAGDQNINSVVLALNADSNTFITDASNNNFAITPNGDTRPSAFSPYNTSWSNYFDGTGDYLNGISSNTLQFGTGDFTVECWVNPIGTNTFSAEKGFFQISTVTGGLSTSYTGGVVAAFTNGGIYFVVNSLVSGGATLSLNRWYHIALTRQSSTVRGWLDGQQIATASNSSDLTANNLVIGGYYNLSYLLDGYISNFRVVKGTALYSSAFTPSTSPFTAVSGTSVLTCQSNRFIDNSTNNFTITRNGDVRVSPISPFAETDTTTGSGYFDGTGDFLTASSNEAFSQTGNFTVQCWVYLTATPSNFVVLFGEETTNYIKFAIDTNRRISVNQAGVGVRITGNTTIPLNVWTHVAYVKNGTNLTAYFNGVSDGTGTITGSSGVASANTLNIGREPFLSAVITGYISDLRVSKNAETITLPTSPLTAIANTSLLTLQNRISYNNSQPVDESGVKNIITRAGNASVGSYTPHTPAGWSAYFDGTGDYLSIPNNEAFNLGTGDFTFECWVMFEEFSTSTSTGDSFFSGNGNPSVDFAYVANSLRIGRYPISWDNTFNFTPNLNQWYHIAYTRSSGTLRVFVNGSLIGSANNTIPYTVNGTTALIGADGDLSSRLMKGYLSNHRLIKGTALYTSNFTPSTTPLEPIANTSLLTLRGPSFTDDGPNRFAITRNGDTRITPFSPFKTHTIAPDSHSVYFDGTGDFLTLASNTAFNVGSNDACVECWVYFNVTPTTQIINGQNSSISSTMRMGVWSGTFRYTINNDTLRDTGISAVAGVWYHLCLTITGGVARYFINGVLRKTDSGLGNVSARDESYIIGTEDTNAVNGYISNFRFTNGSIPASYQTSSTSVGTTIFTPPVSTLTRSSQGANSSHVVILTCQSSTAIDNSNNAFAITVNGNAQPTKYNPFGETATTSVQYSPASHGGSYYFDGTGDYLSLPGATSFTLPNTMNWTVECWIYPNWTPSTDYRAIFSTQSASGTSSQLLWATYGTEPVYLSVLSGGAGVGSLNLAAPNNVIRMREWQHIALVNSSGTLRQYHNGVPLGSGTAGNYTSPTTVTIGSAGTGSLFTGYIAGFNVLNGSAKYTSAFVPPAAPPSPVAGTTLLLNGTNAAIADGVGKNVLETVGNARIINGIKKYGTGSIYFDGTGDYLLAPSTPDYDFGTGNFTIEMWVNIPIVTATWNTIISRAYGIAGGWRLYKNQNNNQLRWYSNLTSVVLTTGSTLQNDTWSHIAVVRSSGTLSIYIDGVSRGSASDTSNYNPGNYAVEIGSGVVTSAFPYTGYIDDLRITKGVARYTSNFTPPTSSLKLK